jgi:hypothetical protein
MEETNGRQSDSKFDMPFNYRFYERDVPFIVDLKSKEQASQSCQKKCCSKYRVPDFSMKLK